MSYLSQSVQWHLTEACPNRCKHCYIGQSSNTERRKDELDFPDFVSILDNLARFEQKYGITIDSFSLTGGDPFEHKDFEKLLQELVRRKKQIKILGIPERITDENIYMLEKYGITAYQVSLDGLPVTHDNIRGAGSFQRTIKAIRKIGSSKIHPLVMFTLHDGNMDEMFELIDYLDDLNIKISFSFDFLVFEGNACTNFSTLSKEKVDEIIHRYRNKAFLLRQHKRKLILREKVKLFETLDIQGASTIFEKYSYVCGCSCGMTSIAILPNGNVYPCRRLPIGVGNLLQEEYGQIFINNPLMRKLRRISSFMECVDCDYAKVCRGCPALAYSVSGDPFSAMPYCSQKEKVTSLITEPDISCSEEDELLYITNTLTKHISQDGVTDNKSALYHDIYKKVFILARSRKEEKHI